MYYNYSEEELRSFCRTSIESFEIWARRLIHERMIETYGPDYIDKKMPDGNFLIKRDVRDHVHMMLAKEPERSHRVVDTLFMDHIIYFLTNQNLYDNVFKPVLKDGYPLGPREIEIFIKRIVKIRNALSHANTISVRQAEKAICYSNDFIDEIKKYQKGRGKEEVWNVPRIIKVTDSFGNVFENPTETHGSCSIFKVSQKIYCGNTYSVHIEVDASFTEEEYDIFWWDNGKKIKENTNQKQYTVTFSDKDVSENHIIHCDIVSKKEWHRYKTYDCKITLMFSVFPPIE